MTALNGPADAAAGLSSSAPSGPERGRGQLGSRARGKGRGRGRGRSGAGPGASRGGGTRGETPETGRVGPQAGSGRAETGRPLTSSPPSAVNPTHRPQTTGKGATDNDGSINEVEAEVCFICASHVVHQSIAPCNHRTCHICALRMRALYKNKECAHCRVCPSCAGFPCNLLTD